MKQICEKVIEYDKDAFQPYIDQEKVFDKIPWKCCGKVTKRKMFPTP